MIISSRFKQTLDLGGWSVERCVDMGDVIKFTFDAGTSLGGFATMTLWASGASGAIRDATNIIWQGGASWGMGFNATNELKDNLGEIQGSLTQKTLLS